MSTDLDTTTHLMPLWQAALAGSHAARSLCDAYADARVPISLMCSGQMHDVRVDVYVCGADAEQPLCVRTLVSLCQEQSLRRMGDVFVERTLFITTTFVCESNGNRDTYMATVVASARDAAGMRLYVSAVTRPSSEPEPEPKLAPDPAPVGHVVWMRNADADTAEYAVRMSDGSLATYVRDVDAPPRAGTIVLVRKP